MIEWRLYYGDGTVFDSSMGSWTDAPARNVQGLATPDPVVGVETDTPLHGRSFYIWWPGADKPWSVDWGGLLDYLLEVGAITPEVALAEVPFRTLVTQGVKFGRSLGNIAFRETVAWMVADARETFGPKSGFHENEVPTDAEPPPLS